MSITPERKANNIQDEASVYEAFLLTNAEQDALLKVAASAYRIGCIADFEAWVKSDVAAFFPHAMMLCAAGSVTGVDVHIEKVLGIGYPKAFLDNLGVMTSLFDRPFLRRWLEQNKPQLIDEPMIEVLLSPFEQEVKVFGLVNIAAYGALDLSVGRGTYFSFSRIPGSISVIHGKLLEMVVPSLHHALRT